MHFEDTIGVKGLWGHFDGSVAMPAVSMPPTTAEDIALAQWNKDNLSVTALCSTEVIS
jgi:hypothetical protein